mmetsp:Transcript_12485/g.52523  ORF Transcript_12485/g.52523 Transcript_12485/m.52523 type:complete len:361 (+) Transcript_12485:1239-2321(+)
MNNMCDASALAVLLSATLPPNGASAAPSARRERFAPPPLPRARMWARLPRRLRGQLRFLVHLAQLGHTEPRVSLEIIGVEVVDAHVAILATSGEGAAVGVEGHGVDGAEVAGHAAELLLENLVIKLALELAALVRGSCHLRSVLPTAQHDVLHYRRDRGTVHRRRVLVRLQARQRLGVPELGGLVNRRGNEVRLVLGPVQVTNVLPVRLLLLDNLHLLGVPDAQVAVLTARVERLIAVAPDCARDAAVDLALHRGRGLCLRVLVLDVVRELQDVDRRGRLHEWVRGEQRHLVAAAVLHVTRGRVEALEAEELLPRVLVEVPDLHLAVRAGGEDARGLLVDVARPHGTVVPNERAQPPAVV